MEEIPISSMKDKQLYGFRDVTTSNPRKLFRRISDVMEKMGYRTDYSSDTVKIRRDEVGESGFVNALLAAEKEITREEEGKGNLMLDFAGAPGPVKWVMPAGVVMAFTGLAVLLMFSHTSGLVMLLSGIVLAGIAVLSMMKRQPATVEYRAAVWVTGAGEIYRASLTQSRGVERNEQGVEQEQVVSELTVRVAAETYPPVSLEELEADIRFLVENLESLAG